jgi:hypothetical protein
MAGELTADEINAVSKVMDNLGSAYWKEIFAYAHIPMRNHVIAREQVKRAYEQLKAVVEKWA